MGNSKTGAAAQRNNIVNLALEITVIGTAKNAQAIAREAFDKVAKHFPSTDLRVWVNDDVSYEEPAAHLSGRTS